MTGSWNIFVGNVGNATDDGFIRIGNINNTKIFNLVF